MEWTRQFYDRVWLEYGFSMVPAEQTKQEIKFIEQALKLRKNESVLDLCCGIGRIGIPLAKKGYRVTGLDSSRDYIRKAKSDSMAMKARPVFHEGDARKIPFVNKFDACFCAWLSFGMHDEEADLRVLRGVAKALRQRGRFLLDVPNRDYVVRHFQQRTWSRAGRGYVMEQRSFHSDTSRLATTWIFAGGGPVTRKKSDIRLYATHEMDALLARAGFKVTKRLATLSGGRPGFNSPRLSFLAQRR